MATDIVAGLRILRGIGGEQTFARNYAEQSQRTRQAGASAGVWQARSSRQQRAVLRPVPGRADLAGRPRGGRGPAQRRRADQLLRVRGVHGLADPDLLRAGPDAGSARLVSARKAIAVLAGQPPWRYAGAVRCRLPDGAALCMTSGRASPPGAGRADDDRLRGARRLGRAGRPAGPLPAGRPRAGQPGGRRRAEPAAAPERARARQQAERARLAERERALAGEEVGRQPGQRRPGRRADRRRSGSRSWSATAGSQVFAGTLQEAIDPHGRLTLEQAEAALYTAAAEDVFLALDGGWQGQLDESGPGAVRRSAAAGGAGPGAGPRRRHPDHGRADLGGGRPHRGDDRRAAGRVSARAGRPSSPPAHRCCCTTPTGWRCCPGSGWRRTAPTRSCCGTTRGYRCGGGPRRLDDEDRVEGVAR